MPTTLHPDSTSSRTNSGITNATSAPLRRENRHQSHARDVIPDQSRAFRDTTFLVSTQSRRTSRSTMPCYCAIVARDCGNRGPTPPSRAGPFRVCNRDNFPSSRKPPLARFQEDWHRFAERHSRLSLRTFSYRTRSKYTAATERERLPFRTGSAKSGQSPAVLLELP
jgi:hypothetical protein